MNLRRPSGVLIRVDPDSPCMETHTPTFTCGHCQATKAISSKDPDLGGTCRVCWSMLCGPCVDKGVCVPWEKQMEAQEARYESRRSMGLT